MAQEMRTTTSSMTREVAEKIMAAGQVTRGGVVVHVFDNTLSNLPPIKNEAMADQDFNIITFCGDIKTTYGDAWIFEVGARPNLPTASWLVGQKSIIGDNLQKFANRHGGFAKILPLWVHLAEVTPPTGNPYWSLSTPKLIADALDTAPPNGKVDELDDLPF